MFIYMASVGGLFFMTKLKKRSWEMNALFSYSR